MDSKVEPLNRDRAGHEDLYHRLASILSEIIQMEIDPSIRDVFRKEIDTWDSVNHLRFVLELEQVFQTTLSDEEISELQSLREVEALLVRHGVLGSLKMDT